MAVVALCKTWPSGPTGTPPDDQFGGPQPDNAHFTGVIIRFNPDGSTPVDNPFFAAGAVIGGDAGENIQRMFAYGIRNSFGMAFDPLSGDLWMLENGDDTFDEINRVVPKWNSGWVKIMGPLDRLNQYKSIETDHEFFGLQQDRWSPTMIAGITRRVRWSACSGLPGSFSNVQSSVGSTRSRPQRLDSSRCRFGATFGAISSWASRKQNPWAGLCFTLT